MYTCTTTRLCTSSFTGGPRATSAGEGVPTSDDWVTMFAGGGLRASQIESMQNQAQGAAGWRVSTASIMDDAEEMAEDAVDDAKEAAAEAAEEARMAAEKAASEAKAAALAKAREIAMQAVAKAKGPVDEAQAALSAVIDELQQTAAALQESVSKFDVTMSSTASNVTGEAESLMTSFQVKLADPLSLMPKSKSQGACAAPRVKTADEDASPPPLSFLYNEEQIRAGLLELTESAKAACQGFIDAATAIADAVKVVAERLAEFPAALTNVASQLAALEGMWANLASSDSLLTPKELAATLDSTADQLISATAQLTGFDLPTVDGQPLMLALQARAYPSNCAHHLIIISSKAYRCCRRRL